MFKKFVSVFLALLAFTLIFTPVKVYAMPAGFQKSTLATNLDQPDALAQAPDGRIFVVLKTGTIKIYTNNALLATPFLTLPVDANQEHGLLGIAFDPQFATNHYVYLTYVNASPNEFRVSRFTANGNTADPASEKILLRSTQALNPYHISGTIRFGPDGKLWISVGNNAINQNSQDLSNIQGKILRINPDGSIPTDNPYYGLTGENGAIWAYGFRNPYRFSFLPDGRPIVGDVGEATTEEVNVVIKGGNYGWPNCEGSCTSVNSSYINPLFSYAHNGASAAIVGGMVYKGSAFPSMYQGQYFYGDYANGFIRYLNIDANGNYIADNAFDTTAGSVVDMMQGTDGNLYYVTIANQSFAASSGSFYKISYDANNVPPNPLLTADKIAGSTPLTVAFSSQGSYDPSGNPLTYAWNFGDGSSATTANPTHTYTTVGTYTASLTINNGKQTAVATKKIYVGTHIPVPTITTPSVNTHYNAGQTISFSGDGTDVEDGTLPASAYSWTIIFHHQTHVHPFINQVSGVKNGTFVIPNTGEPSAETSYEIFLTVTDSDGLTNTVSRIISPNVVNLTFQSTPAAGLTFTLDGIPHTTPYTVAGVVGFQHGVSTPALQTVNGYNYTFNNWNDTTPQTHTITTPATDTTYTAGFDQTASGNGYVHFRIRDIDKNGNWTGKFINDATAKLTDAAGNIVYQTEASKTVNGEDGWVYFDAVPAGSYGTLSYKQGATGVWKQTTCQGAGTTQNSTISNTNTQGFTAAWQNTIKVTANTITWCVDEGLRPATTGNLALRVALIEKDPTNPTKYISFNHINGATVKLTDSTGNTVVAAATSQASGGEDGWAVFQNIPAGTYGILAYKSGYSGFWKETGCDGSAETNVSIQNASSENIKAAWNNQVSLIAGVTNYCYDLGLQGTGALHFRVREFDSTGAWTGRFINGATAKLTDETGTVLYQTATSTTVNGEDGWVYFDNAQSGYYATLSYKSGYNGVWKQTDCTTGGSTQNVTTQNATTENQVAATQGALHLLPSVITWCADTGLQSTTTTTTQTGHVHLRVREIDNSNQWTGKFINDATAKLTDAAGNVVSQTLVSKTVNGEDGWVYFDNVPVSTYGVLIYKSGLQGAWRQTDCGSGSDTQTATIQNQNTAGLTAAWQNNVQIQANQVTWCKDEGLKLIPQVTPTPTPTAGPATVQITPTPTPVSAKDPTTQASSSASTGTNTTPTASTEATMHKEDTIK